MRNDHITGRPYERFDKSVIEVDGVKLQQIAFLERAGLKVDLNYILSLNGNSGVFLEEIKKSEANFRKQPAVQEANALVLSQSNVRASTLFGKKEDGGAFVFSPRKREHQILLFDKIMKLKPVALGVGGLPKYNKAFKEKYKSNPVVDAFGDLIEALSLHANFIVGFYKILRGSPDNRDGRLHTIFRYLEVKTGRVSSTKPNLQNITQRSKTRSKIIKRQFICEDCNLILKKDFSAHEIRVWGISARDKILASTFWKGMRVRLEYLTILKIPDELKEEWKTKLNAADVHRIGFGMAYGVQPETVNSIQRNGWKGTIFGSLYGLGMLSLGKQLVKYIPGRMKEIEKELKEIEDQISEYKKAA
jgi:very-short-patch-repair endonuclease